MALIPSVGGFIPTSLADWLNGQDVDRMNRYREMLDFYGGNQWDRRRRAGETRLTMNYARALVRKTVSYVFSDPVSFSVAASKNDQVSEELAAAVETRLNELAIEQDLHSLDFDTMVDAAVVGDGAFKVTWSVDDRAPVVTSVDPAGLWAWTRPDNVRKVTRVVQRYYLTSMEAFELFGIGTITGAGSVPVVEDWTADRVTIEVGGQTTRDEANPYGWIPYVIFPNAPRPHELWGDSDLVDLIDTCRELNRRMTVVSRILQVSGNPITVLENVTGASGIQADEGAVWELPPDSKAYLLDMLAGGGVRLHIEYIDALYRALYDLAETPRTAFGDSGRNVSGAALEVEIQPLVQKVQRRRRIWDAVYRQRNAMLLDLLERFGGEPIGGVRRTEAVWGSVLPNDRQALVLDEVQLVASQIHSRQTAMNLLGDVDQERELALIQEEADMGLGAQQQKQSAAAAVDATSSGLADRVASGA
ncbi:MAG: phage portal protein [Nitrolancea sp.]